MKKMSFSEYVNSKVKLREAIHRTPQKTLGYRIHRQCRLMVQNSEGKRYLPLGKGHVVKVIWLYEDKRKPIPIRIFFEGIKSVDEDLRFYTTWSGEKLAGWLDKNANLI